MMKNSFPHALDFLEKYIYIIKEYWYTVTVHNGLGRSESKLLRSWKSLSQAILSFFEPS
jgi:hypothetical protein